MATSPGVLTLPDIAYEKATVRTTINGRSLSLDGWVRGPGCPARVVAEYARKHHQFAVSPDAPNAAYIEFLTDALRVVLPDLTPEDADAIAGDEARAESILRHLKWFGPQAVEDDENPEVVSEDGTATMPPSSLISLPTSGASAPTALAG